MEQTLQRTVINNHIPIATCFKISSSRTSIDLSSPGHISRNTCPVSRHIPPRSWLNILQITEQNDFKYSICKTDIWEEYSPIPKTHLSRRFFLVPLLYLRFPNMLSSISTKKMRLMKHVRKTRFKIK